MHSLVQAAILPKSVKVVSDVTGCELHDRRSGLGLSSVYGMLLGFAMPLDERLKLSVASSMLLMPKHIVLCRQGILVQTECDASHLMPHQLP